ncbi:Cell division cycle protein 27 homolog [Caenorhabditis elegans]|uniref:Cell division cycle protein 27 homolog n=1 Tax=Caenorhabditis elegans TaxID=6239 RepID=CDC27_CAEEL|nr:Cell division cycle protein 27 homolog [Caenorhabditis elegans]Q9N593.1 RecName: Full=Cell division cycle protein 27 homolog; AltName: Full=Anaphase-promoting complex subunit 3; AltName: Full=Metaphase-to-anaphase transition defect protein 1 [Caenorhabditis elegans]CCD66209.1 Cell division cycle protein 27 homolog [Caenorhabditis elegans]|eukprot:NP_001021714.1 Cell division cycle protein 27 homolog [Caenorhabditis elegans]
MKESAASVAVRPQLREVFERFPADAHRTIEDEIHEMMKCYAFDDAIFLAELHYETDKSNNSESLLLYADCLYRANKKEECYGLLSSVKLSGARLFYLLARVSYDLNKIDDCRGALFEHDDGVIRKDILEEPRVASHANLLHAQMLCDESYMDLALESCQKSLDENILLWSAIITYLRFGGHDLAHTFEKHHRKSNGLYLDSPASSLKSETPSPNVPGPSSSSAASTAEPSRLESSVRRSTRGTIASANRETRNTTSNITPRQSTPGSTPSRINPTAPRKSSRISEMTTRRTESSVTGSRSSLFTEPERPHTRATHSSRNRANAALNSDTENSNASNTRTRSGIASVTRGSSSSQRTNPVRTSIRIADAAAAANKTAKTLSQRRRNEKQPLVSRNSNLARSLSGSTNSVASTASERPSEDEVSQINPPLPSVASSLNNDEPMDIVDGVYDPEYKKLFDVYQHIALIEESISTYNWRSADALFAKLDRDIILNTSMVRLQLGRACFEQSEYRECRNILDDLHKRRKWKVDGTELLSTSMWHLQDTHALSALSQILTTESRERPQSWCAAGNCFSLQRQHTQAIECMERAIQLDKRFAYAYTLLGHELIVQDELDKAAGSFRSALLLSPRDYRAWYGLGLVHLKKEQNLTALTNIQKAVNINPTNRAMLCTLSQIEQQRGQIDTALVLIDRALTLNPLDVACRFNRSRLLFEANRNEECLVELDKLKASSPDEAFIFHLLARVHRRMGNTHLALLNYSWAAELDPRGEQNITDSNVINREEYEDDEYGSPV